MDGKRSSIEPLKTIDWLSPGRTTTEGGCTEDIPHIVHSNLLRGR